MERRQGFEEALCRRIGFERGGKVGPYRIELWPFRTEFDFDFIADCEPVIAHPDRSRWEPPEFFDLD